MDLYKLVEKAVEDTSKQYLLKQHPAKGEETPVLEVPLYAEQVAERVIALQRQHLEYAQKDSAMLTAMKNSGGSFVKCLAAAMLNADAENYAKLVMAFPEYVADYKKRSEA